jgi:tRNA(Ile)-lysidine synthetase-like protein
MKPYNSFNLQLLNQQKLYVVAVSFGPDSMALLDLLRVGGYRLHVAHINYHKRPESNLEQSSLEQYCFHHELPLSVLNVVKTPKGNFQQEARKIRYDFFNKLVKQYSAEAILTAHHQDDHLETAMMQIDRQSLHDVYGIRPVSHWQGVTIIRPLQSATKAELIEYCFRHQVPYAIDSSNQSFQYTRNRYRHQLKQWSRQQREAMLKTILKMNEQNQHMVQELLVWRNRYAVDIKVYLSWSLEKQFLYWRMKFDHFQTHQDISKAFLNKITTMLTSKKPNLTIQVQTNWLIEKAYDQLYTLHNDWLKPYQFLVKKPMKHQQGILQFQFKKQQPYPFPFMCRNAKPNDRIKIQHYYTSFRRLAIDWKMPKHLRTIWPVIANSRGQILYIPRYQKDYQVKAKNWLMIRE